MEDCHIETEGDRFRAIDEEVLRILDAFAKDSGATMITYEELKSFPYNQWFDVSDGVRFMRIKDLKSPVCYISELDPLKAKNGVPSYGKQKHDCKEIVTVESGELIETYERHKKYEKGDVAIYPKGFIHKPYSKLLSRYRVEFIDPKKTKPCQAKN